MNEHFNRLFTVIEELKILPKNIANLDENGVAGGESKAGKVVGSNLTKRSMKITSGARTWVSILECIKAEGGSLDPLVIFTGQSPQAQHFPPNGNFPHHWKYTYSLSGWSNTKIAMGWLEKIYLPSTKPDDPREWRLLILDGHYTHTGVDFMFECRQNKVRPFYLPAHSSQKTQPLDVAVFSALKEYYHQYTARFTSLTASAPINKQRFIQAYEAARTQSFTDKNIRSGFRQTGICPFNRSIVQEVGEKEGDILTADQPSLIISHKPENDIHGEVWTPYKSQDVRNQLVQLKGQEKAIRLLWGKAGKAIDRGNMENATLQHRLNALEIQFDSVKPQAKRTVNRDANSLFTDLDDVMKKQKEEAKVVPAKRKRAAPGTAPRSQLPDETEEIIQEVIVAMQHHEDE